MGMIADGRVEGALKDREAETTRSEGEYSHLSHHVDVGGAVVAQQPAQHGSGALANRLRVRRAQQGLQGGHTAHVQQPPPRTVVAR